MSTLRVLADNKATFHYRQQPADSAAGKAVLALVQAGKLTADQVEAKNADGKDFVKRKSATITFPVLDVSSVIVDGTLTPAQIAHLQAVLTQYLESKQKPEVDNCTGTVLDWAAILASDFAQAAAAKITVIMRKAAADAIKETLVAICKPKAVETLYSLIEAGFPATQLVKYLENRKLLEGIETKFCEALAANTEVAEAHAEVFEMCLNNLKKVSSPEVTVSEDDFM